MSAEAGHYVLLDGFPRNSENCTDFTDICGLPEYARVIGFGHRHEFSPEDANETRATATVTLTLFLFLSIFLFMFLPLPLPITLTLTLTLHLTGQAFYIDVPDEVMVERIMQRGKEFGREDDNYDTAKKRIATFHESGKPTLEYLHEQGVKVHRLDGTKSPDEVYLQCLACNTPLTRRLL
jgi:hypothetical protein